MDFSNDTIPPTFPPSAEEDMTSEHQEDLVYLIVCIVVFVVAVFGTMIFDKKQQTEQKVQRIRLIMRSLVIQSVEEDGHPVGKPKSRTTTTTSEKDPKHSLDVSTSSSSTSSGTTADDNTDQESCEDVENQLVGEIVQEGGSSKNTTKKISFAWARWKQKVTSKVSHSRSRQSASTTSTSTDSEQDSSTSSEDHDNDDDEDVCPICIMPFQVGEKVCWSKNPECDHAFHTECVKPWLMDHSECPCCRKDYLTLDQHERDEQERRARDERTLRDVNIALSI